MGAEGDAFDDWPLDELRPLDDDAHGRGGHQPLGAPWRLLALHARRMRACFSLLRESGRQRTPLRSPPALSATTFGLSRTQLCSQLYAANFAALVSISTGFFRFSRRFSARQAAQNFFRPLLSPVVRAIF